MNKSVHGAMNCAMNSAPPELHPARDLRELSFMKDLDTPESFRRAREIGDAMITLGEFDPV